MDSRRVGVITSVGVHAALLLLLAVARMPEPPSPPRQAPIVFTTFTPAPSALRDAQAARGRIGAAPTGALGTADPGGPQLGPPRTMDLTGSPEGQASGIAAPRLGQDSLERPSPSPALQRLELPPVQAAASPAVRASSLLPSPAELLGQTAAVIGAADAEGRPEATADAVGWEGSRRELVRQQPVSFPSSLVAEGRDVDVVARIHVGASGAVVKVEIVRSSGDAGIDSSVERALRGYLFSPVGGDTIDAGLVSFHFRLRRGF